MFLGVCTALMLTTMNVNLMSWLGFVLRDVGVTDEAGGWTLRRKGLRYLFHLLLSRVRAAGGMWGSWQTQSVIWGVKAESWLEKGLRQRQWGWQAGS